MRFILGILGIVLLQAAILAAQEPSSSEGSSPPVRRYRQSRVFTPTLPEGEAPPSTQANQYGVPAAQQSPAQMVTGPAVVQPNQGVVIQSAPPQAGTPAATAPAPVTSAPAQPPPNLPPPAPPQVTYRDGQLTVQALNSTLGSVLAAIRNKTGIQFEGLDAASERIVVSMGPAPEGEVLAAILTGSHFDYIAIERSDSPGIVQRVILTPRTGGSAAPAIGAAPAVSSGEEEEAADEDPDNLRTPQDTPARPPVMQAQPISPQPNPQPQGDPPVAKTPEQLLEELKQIQQRQQQQQQQQAAPQKIPQ